MTYQPTAKEFADRLSLILSDAASTNALVANCPALADLIAAAAPPERIVEALPHPDTITAAQATLWDNWPSGFRAARYPNRYALTLKVWTTEDVQFKGKGNHANEVSASLMDAKALKAWVKDKSARKLKNPIAPDYLTGLADVADMMEVGQLVGVFASKGDGTTFHNHQWVLMTQVGSEWRAVLSIDGEQIAMPEFSDRLANGAKVKVGNRISQSRLDRCGFSESWSTLPIDYVVEFRAA